MRGATRRYRAAKSLDRERARLYIEGRALDPPVTFSDIAVLADVSQAAVVQAVDRERKRQAKGE